MSNVYLRVLTFLDLIYLIGLYIQDKGIARLSVKNVTRLENVPI